MKSDPVSRKDIDDAIESFRRWLVDNGVLDIRHDLDRMMLEVQAMAEGREYDGPSSVGETIAAVTDPLDVDNVAMAAMTSAAPKLKVAGDILFWLSQAAHPIVASSYGPNASRLDAERLPLMERNSSVLRSTLIKIQGLEAGLVQLGALQDAYVREIFGRTVVHGGHSSEEDVPDRDAVLQQLAAEPARSTLLLEAHRQAIAALRQLRYYVENVYELPQMLPLAPPRTLDEWRQCQGILEQALLDAGFSTAEAGKMFGAATDSIATKKLKRRTERRRTRGETVLLIAAEGGEENKAARRNVPRRKTAKRARSPNDGDRSRTASTARSGGTRARVNQQREALDKVRASSKLPAGTKASRAKSRS